MSDASWGIDGDIRNQGGRCTGFSSVDSIYGQRSIPRVMQQQWNAPLDASTFEMYEGPPRRRRGMNRTLLMFILLFVVLALIFFICG